MAKKPRSVLVTGGAGFIGSNLVFAIQRRWPEASVTVLDDFRSGHFKNLQGFKGDVIAQEASHFHTAEKFDVIFHLASITDTTVKDQRLMIHDNVEGFRNILDLARVGNSRLVYASSAATYGIANEKMAEDFPAAPANVYAFSKVVLDNLAAIARDDGMKLDGVRYFNVYGPGEEHKGAFASMIYQLGFQMRGGARPRIFKFGEQKRDFVHVDDVVEGTILAAEKGKSNVYNLGSGVARTFNDVVECLNTGLGTKLAPVYFDNPYDFYQSFTEADVARAKSDLGYKPKFALEPGIKDYLTRLGWIKK